MLLLLINETILCILIFFLSWQKGGRMVLCVWCNVVLVFPIWRDVRCNIACMIGRMRNIVGHYGQNSFWYQTGSNTELIKLTKKKTLNLLIVNINPYLFILVLKPFHEYMNLLVRSYGTRWLASRCPCHRSSPIGNIYRLQTWSPLDNVLRIKCLHRQNFNIW